MSPSLTDEAFDLLTVAQAAELVGMKVSWMYDHVRELPVTRIGRHVRLRRSELARWLDERTCAGMAR